LLSWGPPVVAAVFARLCRVLGAARSFACCSTARQHSLPHLQKHIKHKTLNKTSKFTDKTNTIWSNTRIYISIQKKNKKKKKKKKKKSGKKKPKLSKKKQKQYKI
jgi:hypothetical protein